MNCRIAAREDDLGHTLGIYEFSPQILFYVCCRREESSAMEKYILALDQGTTSSREILFNSEQNILAIHQHELTQHHPYEGWVEQNPMEIWSTQYAAMLEVLTAADVR